LAEGLQLFVTGDAFTRSVDQNSASDSFDITGAGVTVGGTYGFGNGLIGIAGNYSRPKVNYARDVSQAKAETWQVGAFTSYAIAFLFGQAHFGYGQDEHETERAGVVNPLRATPGGSHVTAGAKLGYLAPVGVLRVGPVAALDYAKAKIDSYTEEGDAALNLNVESMSTKALTGSVGAELRGDFSLGGSQLRPFASLTVAKDFTGGSRTIRYSQTSAPTIVNSWELDDRSKKAYGRISTGGSAQITTGLTLDAVLSTTIGRDDETDSSAHIGLRLGM
jgi:outer membrane autotransporter protein